MFCTSTTAVLMPCASRAVLSELAALRNALFVTMTRLPALVEAFQADGALKTTWAGGARRVSANDRTVRAEPSGRTMAAELVPSDAAVTGTFSIEGLRGSVRSTARMRLLLKPLAVTPRS